MTIPIAATATPDRARLTGGDAFRQVADHAGEMILVAQDGLLRYSNPAVSKHLGYRPRELARMSFGELVHPDDRRQVLARRLAGLVCDPDPEATLAVRVLTRDRRVRRCDLRVAVLEWQGRPAMVSYLWESGGRRNRQSVPLEPQ